MIKIWLIWLLLAAVLAVGEVLTAGFFLLCFSIGAVVAGILALVGVKLGWQFGAFLLVSFIIFIASRRLAERVSKEQPAGIGADRFIGHEGIVLEEINNVNNTGRIRLKKEEWRAESANGEVIEKGGKVKVTRIEGTHLIVKSLKEGE